MCGHLPGEVVPALVVVVTADEELEDEPDELEPPVVLALDEPAADVVEAPAVRQASSLPAKTT